MRNGLGGSFAPGLHALASSGVKVQRQTYPAGAAGIRLSLETIAARIREGSHIAGGWARQQLLAAGVDGRGPQSTRRQAGILLDAVRRHTAYTPDPVNSEQINSAAAILCLQPGVCMKGGDCDDMCVALGSALMGIGIPVRVVKQNFGSEHQEHVLIHAQDERGDWFPLDPSTNLPAGTSHEAVSELSVDPLTNGGVENVAGSAELVSIGKTPIERRLVRMQERRGPPPGVGSEISTCDWRVQYANTPSSAEWDHAEVIRMTDVGFIKRLSNGCIWWYSTRGSGAWFLCTSGGYAPGKCFVSSLPPPPPPVPHAPLSRWVIPPSHRKATSYMAPPWNPIFHLAGMGAAVELLGPPELQPGWMTVLDGSIATGARYQVAALVPTGWDSGEAQRWFEADFAVESIVPLAPGMWRMTGISRKTKTLLGDADVQLLGIMKEVQVTKPPPQPLPAPGPSNNGAATEQPNTPLLLGAVVAGVAAIAAVAYLAGKR